MLARRAGISQSVIVLQTVSLDTDLFRVLVLAEKNRITPLSLKAMVSYLIRGSCFGHS
jgi:hypothetical protein